MVSSKSLTCFSDLRPDDDVRQFLKIPQYIKYLEDYTAKFNLRPYIHLSTPVLSVRRRGKGHVVRYRNPDGTEEEWECDAVAVCSGLHVTPAIPEIPGIEKVPTVLHSAKFKSRKDFGEDKTVVVLGVGETGQDIGLLAVKSPTKRVVMCHKNGWVNAPKVIDGAPLASTLY